MSWCRDFKIVIYVLCELYYIVQNNRCSLEVNTMSTNDRVLLRPKNSAPLSHNQRVLLREFDRCLAVFDETICRAANSAYREFRNLVARIRDRVMMETINEDEIEDEFVAATKDFVEHVSAMVPEFVSPEVSEPEQSSSSAAQQ